MKSAQSSNWLDIPQDDLDYVLDRTLTCWESMRGGHLLITGGTGFVGKWLLGTFLHANRILTLNAYVTVLSRNVESFQRAYPELMVAKEVRWINSDVRTFELSGVPAVTHIVHAAADVVQLTSGPEIFETCVQGTQRVLKIAKDHASQRMLMVSSGAVYGTKFASSGATREDCMTAPDCMNATSAYAEGKRAAELMCAFSNSDLEIEIPVARCFAFVGPHLALKKQFAIGNFIRSALLGEPIVISGDGTPLRSYLYSADMVVWLWTILCRGEGGRPYNVGGTQRISIRDLASEVVQSIGSDVPIEVGQVPETGVDVHAYVPDVTRVQSELGVSQGFDLRTSIARTAQWAMRSQSSCYL